MEMFYSGTRMFCLKENVRADIQRSQTQLLSTLGEVKDEV
jgi:hypothetical protein